MPSGSGRSSPSPREERERSDVDLLDFTDEASLAWRFGFVIGADGLRSALRAMVLWPREQFDRHLGLVLALYTAPNERAGPLADRMPGGGEAGQFGLATGSK